MNRFDYTTTLAIIGTLFAAMSIVSVGRGKDVARSLKNNAIAAALIVFGVSAVFLAAKVAR